MSGVPQFFSYAENTPPLNVTEYTRPVTNNRGNPRGIGASDPFKDRTARRQWYYDFTRRFTNWISPCPRGK
jgi:hypothetical protein